MARQRTSYRTRCRRKSGNRGANGSWLLQEKISREKLKRKIGKTIKVLVDEPGVGRSSADAPEIDGVVRFKGAHLPIRPGEFGT